LPRWPWRKNEKRVPTVGWLWYGAAPVGSLPTVESAVLDGLRELGYVDGKNIKLEHQYGQGKPDRFLELASNFAKNVDIIFTLGGDLAAAAKKAAATKPIVVGVSEDPVRAKLMESLARPGGNVTGVTFLSNELAGKRVELLKDIDPKLARIAVVWNPAHFDDELAVTQTTAEKLNVQIKSVTLQRMDAWRAHWLLYPEIRPKQ
jgi:putative ABC transport system substrate-binding protein